MTIGELIYKCAEELGQDLGEPMTEEETQAWLNESDEDGLDE